MHKINHNINYISNNHQYDDTIYVNNANDEVLKHIESLRTRLGFARFKLSNGWENNTLGDVECFWKQKQRQSMRDIPIPRFTQQDIIDKRSYIQASGVKHAKARRYRLLSRSYTSPSTKQDSSLNIISSSHSKSSIMKKNCHKSHSIQQSQQQQYISNDEDNDSSNSSIVSSSSSSHQQRQQQQTYYFHHYDKNAYNLKKAASLSPKPTLIHSVSSFDASCVPNDLNGEPSMVKNSLDFITYAIAMTERNQSQENMEGEEGERDELEEEEEEEKEQSTLHEEDMDEEHEDKEDWTKTSQLRLSLSIPSSATTNENISLSSPSSPTNAAAQAMLMFVNRNQSSSSSD